MEELFNNSNIEIKEKNKDKDKINIYNRRNEISEILINTNEPKKTLNKKKILFTSYSNINDLYQNKKIKTPNNSVKSKINTFEFIKKIKKSISPKKKLIFNTYLNNKDSNNKNEEDEFTNNYEHINIKNIINKYIQSKKKQRKENEIKKKEKINEENLKKYKNFLILQENIKDSIMNKKRNEEEEKCEEKIIKILENTNKSSVFNENEYYINCYESQKIYNNEHININYCNLNNNISKSIEYHINLNKIRNKNINKENKSFFNYCEQEYEQIKKLLKNNNDLFKRIHINNIIRKQNIRDNNKKSKYKKFIQKIYIVLIKVIKKKYFELLRFKINSLYYFIKKVIKVIKSFVFCLLKKYSKYIKIVNQFKNIINRLYIKNYFQNIQIYVKREKYHNFILKITKIIIKNCFNYFINQKNKAIKKDEKKIKIENIKNSINLEINLNNNQSKISKSEINNDSNKSNDENKSNFNKKDDKKNVLIRENNNINNNNKNDNENFFLNNVFYHNKEIFKNLRYDDDDFFLDESQKDLSNEINDNNNNINKNNPNEKEKIELNEYFNKIPINIKNNIKKDLTEQIIKEIIDSEITNKEKIINKKSPIIQFENRQKETISNINNNVINSNINSDSSLESSINISLLKKSIGEIKEGRKLNKYFQTKFPIFLKMIINNIKKNYNKIINNLKRPLIIDEEKYINKLNNLINKKIINNNNLDLSNEKNEIEINEQKKFFFNKINIPFCNRDITNKKFIDEKILKEFNLQNELMNKESNEETINATNYDKCLNKCVYDSVNEIIEKKRMYGELGKPLLWMSKNKIIRYNFDNSQYSKKIFIKEIINELKKDINTKIGLIPENYDYMSLDHLISDREKKFIKNIYNDLLENEEKDNNIDLIFTSMLMSISKMVMEQLIEEVIQILNLIEQSRKEPSKFESKSIYSYENEDVPIFFLGDKNDYEEENFFFNKFN